MHVTPSELRAVQREGVLSRFAVLGPVAYVIADLPRGTAGTSLESRCREPHWGLVLRGRLGVRGPGSVDLGPASAFYVPPGPPEHHFEAAEPTVLAGFAPLERDRDLEEVALAATGFEIVRLAPAAAPLPAVSRSAEPTVSYSTARGGIEVETARMGAWIHCRATFGSLSGYTSGWCDLPHWGTVLMGDLAIVWEDQVELLTAGDAYYCPPGPPGHRLEVADEATIIDYTPIDRITRVARRAGWRRFSDVADVEGQRATVDPSPGDVRRTRSTEGSRPLVTGPGVHS